MLVHHQPILIVEDSPEDFHATVRALTKAGLVNPIYHCDDGDEALDFLYQRGAYADAAKAPRPGIILLDLNLPGTDGREVLSVVKADPNLKSLPVIILSTSSDERDIAACYQAGANTYITKPVDIGGFFKAVQRLQEFWIELAVYPKSESLP
jgi:CheY-like chemotaxis protein